MTLPRKSKDIKVQNEKEVESIVFIGTEKSDFTIVDLLLVLRGSRVGL